MPNPATNEQDTLAPCCRYRRASLDLGWASHPAHFQVKKLLIQLLRRVLQASGQDGSNSSAGLGEALDSDDSDTDADSDGLAAPGTQSLVARRPRKTIKMI